MSTAHQSANKVLQDTAYAGIRTKQETQVAKDENIPAAIDEGKRLASDTLQNAQMKAQEYTDAAKDTASAGTQAISETLEATRQEASARSADATARTTEVKDNAYAKAQGTTDATVGASKEKGNLAHDKLYQASEQTSKAVDDFEQQAAGVTNAAVEEGKADVDQTKATAQAKSQGYLQQAKQLADSGLSTAQSYIQAGKDRISPPPEQPVSGITATLASATAATLDTANRSLAYAQATLRGETAPANQSVSQTLNEAVEPKVQAAKEVVEPKIQAAKEAIDPTLQATKDKAAPVVNQAAEAGQKHAEALKEKAAEYDIDASNITQSVKESAQSYTSAGKANLEATKGELAEGKPDEPSIENAPRPYEDTTKPIVPMEFS